MPYIPPPKPLHGESPLLYDHNGGPLNPKYHGYKKAPPPPPPPEPRIVMDKPTFGIFDACMLSLIPLSIGITIGFTIGNGI